MNPWISIIATYGIEFAIELSQIIKDKTDPGPDDFKALKAKYGSKKADDYLTDIGVVPPSVPQDPPPPGDAS